MTVWAVAVVLGALLAAATVDTIVKSAPVGAASSKDNAALADRYVDRLLRGDGDLTQGAPVAEATRNFVSHLVIASPTGSFSDEDRAYLVNIIASRTNLPPTSAVERTRSIPAI